MLNANGGGGGDERWCVSCESPKGKGDERKDTFHHAKQKRLPQRQKRCKYVTVSPIRSTHNLLATSNHDDNS